MADRRTQHRIFGLLDIGTAKIAAAIVVADFSNREPSLRLAGLGLQKSRGVKSGILTDLDDAEEAVRAAIAQAERSAGVTIDSVTAGISGGRMASQYFTAKADIEGANITEADLTRMIDGARAYGERNGRTLIHLNRLATALDGVISSDDPIGINARRIAAQMHAVTADDAPTRNQLLLIERCRLGCDGLVAAPYASALAVTTTEERNLGVTCLDLGAGTTTASVFADGRLVAIEVVPIGGQHLTFDVAKALQTPITEAERIKTLYGTLVKAQSDQHDSFSYPFVGGEDGDENQATRAQLTGIIAPRMAQILGEVRHRLSQNQAAASAGDRFVLTGGASQILGAADFASGVFGRPARIGRPSTFSGVPKSGNSATLATLLGLAHAVAESERQGVSAHQHTMAQQGYLGRVGSWLRTGF